MNDTVAKTQARDEYEIKDDLRSVKRAMKVFRDPQRLKDIQDLIKEQKNVQEDLDALADGDLQKALGINP